MIKINIKCKGFHSNLFANINMYETHRNYINGVLNIYYKCQNCNREIQVSILK